ncbi:MULTISPECIES: hypothetical protein [unclassified Mycolicibacterium]|uniref:hypothetical protein n=1 Tax=unclassified Mycolicibacterium TaxID=2636767 RepID=UPI001F4BE033|nr:hypothetical protein [Mycolicibacterium sp. YH-1]UNB52393.1 hypothetical protein L0M16_31870 [Mycolicibacterium sp. YH-1]HET7739681.1 hypothetical protein [Mycobacterium sp.]
MTGSTEPDILADHSILLAIPAFAPALVVVAVVIWIVMRDRRRADDEDPSSESPASTDEDGSP